MATQIQGRTARSARKPNSSTSVPATTQASVRAFADQEGSACVERAAKIAEAAYFRAERRGFEPGHELEDWLASEVEIDRG